MYCLEEFFLFFTKSTSSWTCYAGFCFLVCFWINYCTMHSKLKLESWATNICIVFKLEILFDHQICHWFTLNLKLLLLIGNIRCNINFGQTFSDHFSTSANFVPLWLLQFFNWLVIANKAGGTGVLKHLFIKLQILYPQLKSQCT